MQNESLECVRQDCSNSIANLKMKYKYLEKCSEHCLSSFEESVLSVDDVCMCSNGREAEIRHSATTYLEDENEINSVKFFWRMK